MARLTKETTVSKRTKPTNVEVRIRTEYDADSQHLCHWPMNRLDELPRIVKMWGLSVTDDEDFDELTDVVGQFRLDSASAYFELIASTSEDAP